MCGVVGVFQPRNPVDSTTLEKAVDAITHRGPDGQRVWLSQDKKVGLGHARLAIIGLSDGAQPIANEDETIHAVVNGELYDHDRIRAELIARGHRFRTHTDSEILLHLYEEKGLDCLQSLRGEFAFILWDSAKRRLFAARDRFGIKPLVFATTADGGVALASEAKALFAAGINAAWDHESFFHASHMQYVLPDRTLFAGIRQIKPGQFLLVENGSLALKTYWDLNYPVAQPSSDQPTEPEIVQSFAAKFREAVRLRLRADTPVCCHLSGGLDSASIVGLAAEMSDQPLHCFTVSFEASQYDELEIAQRMATHVGAHFHPVTVTQQDILENLGNAACFSEGLAVNGHLSAKYLLHKRIKQAGFPVALSGEGSDELLAGYAHLRADLFSADGRDELISKVAKSNSASTGIMLKQGQSLALDAVTARLGFTPSFLEAKGTLGFKLNSVLKQAFMAKFDKRDSYLDLIESLDISGQLSQRNRIDQSTYIWTKTALANYILKTLGDGTELAHGVEGRVPFLDHELFELTKTIPMSMKIKGTREKYVLREAMRGIITDEIYSREKHPFVAPPVSAFANEAARTLLHDEITSTSFASLPFFDQKKLLALIDRFPSMADDERHAYDPVLMTALSASAIHNKFHL